MHTPYCVELRGTLPTVVLPAPERQHRPILPSSSTPGQRLDVARSQALVVSVSRASGDAQLDGGTVALIFMFNGVPLLTPGTLDPDVEHNLCVVGQATGTVVRYIIPLRLTGLSYAADTELTAIQFWTEDLAPLGYGRCTCARVE